MAHNLAPLLAKLGVADPRMVSSISFVAAFTVITFVHITFGELGPKALAIQKARAVALWTSGPLIVFFYCFYPFIWLLNASANVLLRWVGLKPAGEGEGGISAEELEYVFSHARHTHPGDAEINKLMVQALRARRTQAQQIMRPRDQVVALWLDKPIAENLRTAQISGHSRFPVCSGSLDKVEGPAARARMALADQPARARHALRAAGSTGPGIRTGHAAARDDGEIPPLAQPPRRRARRAAQVRGPGDV